MSARLFSHPKASLSSVVNVAAELVVCSFRGVANVVGWVRVNLRGPRGCP